MMRAVSLARCRSDATMASTTPRFGRVERLLPTEVGERRVGLPLPATVGVPLRLPVADEQHAGHGGRTYRTPTAPQPAPGGLVGRHLSLRSRPPPRTGGGGGMAVLRLFAGARDAAGTGRDDVPGATARACSTPPGALRRAPSPTSSSTARSGETVSRASSTRRSTTPTRSRCSRRSRRRGLMATQDAAPRRVASSRHPAVPPGPPLERQAAAVPAPLCRRLRHRGPAGPARHALVRGGGGGPRPRPAHDSGRLRRRRRGAAAQTARSGAGAGSARTRWWRPGWREP